MTSCNFRGWPSPRFSSAFSVVAMCLVPCLFAHSDNALRNRNFDLTISESGTRITSLPHKVEWD